MVVWFTIPKCEADVQQKKFRVFQSLTPSLREQKTKRIDVAGQQVTRLPWDHLIWIWVAKGHVRPYNSFERCFYSRVVKDHQNFILSLLSSPWVSPFLWVFLGGVSPKFPSTGIPLETSHSIWASESSSLRFVNWTDHQDVGCMVPTT